MKECPRCKNLIPDGALFCGSCGATISATPKKTNATPTDSTLCPKCGMPKNQSGKFCLGCGTPLDPDALAGVRSVTPTPEKGGFLRFISGVICVIMLITMITNAINGNSGGDPAKRQNITISVWTPAQDQDVDNNWLVNMQTQFAARYPEYNITWENDICSEGDAVTKAQSDTSSVADVYMFANDQIGALVDYDLLSPLSSHYSSLVRVDNSTAAENSVTYTDGQMYGFPMTNNTWCLYYDKNVFSERDVTSLETMLSKGKVTIPLRNSWTGSCFFLGTGCTIFGEDGTNRYAGFDFANDNGYNAAKKMLTLVSNENAVIRDMGYYSDLIDGYSSAIFTGSWDYPALKEALGDDLGVAQLPTFTYNNETYQMTAMSGTKCVGVNPSCADDTQKMNLCMEFASFLASEQSQIARYEANGTIPSVSTILANNDFANNELVLAEIRTMEYCSIVQPNFAEMNNYWIPMGEFLSELADGNITVSNYREMVNQLHVELNS